MGIKCRENQVVLPVTINTIIIKQDFIDVVNI